MTVLITLTTLGIDTGPLFNLSSSPDGTNFTQFATGIAKLVLEGGYSATVPDGTTTIRVTSTGVCTNYEDITISGLDCGLVATAVVSTPATTTTTTTAPTTGSITINNNSNNPSVTIQEVYVNNILINLNPITAGATLVSTYTVIAGNAQTVYVLTNNAMDSPVKLTISTTPTQTPCLITTGNVTFTELDLSTGPSINLDLGGEGEACN